MIRLAMALPLLVASDALRISHDITLNLATVVAGTTNLRR